MHHLSTGAIKPQRLKRPQTPRHAVQNNNSPKLPNTYINNSNSLLSEITSYTFYIITLPRGRVLGSCLHYRRLTGEAESRLPLQRKKHPAEDGRTLRGRVDDGAHRVADVGLQVGQVLLQSLALAQLARVHLRRRRRRYARRRTTSERGEAVSTDGEGG